MTQAPLLAKAAAPAAKSGSTHKAESRHLRIGEPDDVFEREAERVATEVLTGNRIERDWSLSRMGVGAPLQRQRDCGGASAERHESKEDGSATLRRRAVDSTAPLMAPPIVHEVLRSPGSPLDPATRTFFEPRFGHDFSRVRVHTDSLAAESARAVHAEAYTLGRAVVMGAGRYRPSSPAGRRLIAHELAHTIQQGRQSAVRSAHPEVARPDNPREQEAKVAAGLVNAGIGPIAVSPDGAVRLDRQPDAGAAAPPAAPVDQIISALDEPQENGVGNYAAAFRILDPMWIVVMLQTLEEIRSRGKFDLLRDNSSGTYDSDMPRIRVAIGAVAAKGVLSLAQFTAKNPGFQALPAQQQAEIASYITLGGIPDAPAGERSTADMTSIEKLSRALYWAREGRDAAMKEQLEGLQTPQALFVMVAFAALFAGAQLTPVGWVADALVLTTLTLTAFFTGALLIQVLTDLGKFANAVNATTDEELKADGEALSRAVATGGVALVLALLTHGGREVPPGRNSFGGAVPEGYRSAVTSDGQIVAVPVESIPENAHAMESKGPGGGKGAETPESGSKESITAASAGQNEKGAAPLTKKAPISLTESQERIVTTLMNDHQGPGGLKDLNIEVAKEAAKGGVWQPSKASGADVPLLNGGGREVTVFGEELTVEKLTGKLVDKPNAGATEYFVQINSPGATRQMLLKIVPEIRYGYTGLNGKFIKFFGPDGEAWWSGVFGFKPTP